MAIDITKQALRIAERLRDKATEQGRIPFDRGDLRKSIKAYRLGAGKAAVGSVLPYARAVHDGRGRVIIIPNLDRNPPLGKRKLYIGSGPGDDVKPKKKKKAAKKSLAKRIKAKIKKIFKKKKAKKKPGAAPPKKEAPGKKKKMSKEEYFPRARLKFEIGGRTVFARIVRQPPRRGRPFIQEGAKEMDREGYAWMLPGLEKETIPVLAKKFAGSIKLTVEI